MNRQDREHLITLLRLLKPVPHLKPQEVFEEILPLLVTVAVELLVIRDKKVLLTWRDDKFFRGWHFPGAILSVNESFEDACRRVAREELGVIARNPRLVKIINCSIGSGNPRSHLVSLLMTLDIDAEPARGEWFSRKPHDLISVHKQLWSLIEPYRAQEPPSITYEQL